jgi:hypothetical protein
MNPVIRDKSGGVHLTIYPRGQRKSGKSKTLTVYGVTVAQMVEIIAEAIKAKDQKRKAS